MTTNNSTDPTLDPKAELEQLLGELQLHPNSHRIRAGAHWRLHSGPSAASEVEPDPDSSLPGFVAIEPRTRRASECPLPILFVTAVDSKENLIIQGTPLDRRGFSFFPARTYGTYRIQMAERGASGSGDPSSGSVVASGGIISFHAQGEGFDSIDAPPIKLCARAASSPSDVADDGPRPHRVRLHTGLELELHPIEGSNEALLVVSQFNGRRPVAKEGRVWRVSIGTETVELKYGAPRRLEKYDHRTAVTLLPSVRPE